MSRWEVGERKSQEGREETVGAVNGKISHYNAKEAGKRETLLKKF